MQPRSGPFWDGVEGRAPVPPAAATLGFEFVDADVEAGTIEVAFTATEVFTNPAGNVLGAFLAAMLYDTVGPALLAGKGRIVHRDGDTVFLEAALLDGDATVVTTATATARVIPSASAPTAA